MLLPLRVVLGSLSVYAGFSKLCDPVYFDGGERGSMMRWLSSLHPWKVAEPLLAFAMNHPVGAGLGVAFTEIVVGVLTVLGLWQRVASAAAMTLSAALLFTVSWRSVPVYDAPDLIFLAAWSPLLIAGAPFGSLDGRIALDAWRQYGPEATQAIRRMGAAAQLRGGGGGRRADPADRLDARSGRPYRRRHRPGAGQAADRLRLAALAGQRHRQLAVVDAEPLPVAQPVDLPVPLGEVLAVLLLDQGRQVQVDQVGCHRGQQRRTGPVHQHPRELLGRHRRQRVHPAARQQRRPDRRRARQRAAGRPHVPRHGPAHRAAATA
ncbi:DoxX family protein [Kitasatospora arboriphila]